MNDVIQLFNKQKTYFVGGIIKSYECRINQLNSLESLLKENESELCKALKEDFKTVVW